MAAPQDLLAAARAAEKSLEELCSRADARLRLPRTDLDLSELEEISNKSHLWRNRLMQLRAEYLRLPIATPSPEEIAQDPTALKRHFDTRTYFEALWSRLTLWPRLTTTVALLRKGESVPLYPRPSGIDAMWGEHLRALEDTAWSFHKLANPMPQSQDAREHGCFRDIPLTPGAFLTHAHAASRVAMAQSRPRPVRFLDVGCGGGVKVLMAARYFEFCEGLEYDPAYAEAAGRMLETVGASTCSVMQADGLTFDGYAEYDVIYFFRPMQEAEPMQRLEARIAETARPGTILIAPYPSFAETAERTGCARIENAIYVVRLDEAGAHDLRHAAERVGIHTYDTRARHARNAGFMAPLVEAIWLTGFLE